MGSAPCKALTEALVRALAFAAMLSVALPGVCITHPDLRPAEGASPQQIINTNDNRAAPAEADQEDSNLLTRPWVSTLGALALGVLGLLWMRRRAAQL